MTFTALSAMPFGSASAISFESEADCADFTVRLPDAPSRFGAIGPVGKFRARLRNVAFPEVSLVAGASTAKATTHFGRRSSLVVPFARCETVLRSNSGTHSWAAPYHAFFIPSGEEIAAESTMGAFLRFDIVEAALDRMASGMAGLENPRPGSIDLRTARAIPLQVRGVNWLPVIRAHCDTIDAFQCSAMQLAIAGFDDLILRTVVMMLRPELVAGGGASLRGTRGFDLDQLLEVITAHIADRVTLSDMERWSGRSARTIQLAFEKRFGIGPMQWLRDRRLDLVHARLLAARDGETVRGIARGCGIHRSATLIPEYTQRFGERPSETLRRGGG